MLTLFLVPLIFLAAVGGNSDFPEVKVEQGSIKGKMLETWKGRPINAFMSIPYAKPPVNDLRFKVMQFIFKLCTAIAFLNLQSLGL